MGRQSLAQGVSPGSCSYEEPSPVRATELCRPYRAGLIATTYPGLTPWANDCRPFGASNQITAAPPTSLTPTRTPTARLARRTPTTTAAAAAPRNTPVSPPGPPAPPATRSP